MKKRVYADGSLTIEASFIIPIVLFAYVFVLYSAFYMHDCIQAQNYTVLMANHLMKGCLKNINLETKLVDYEKEAANPLTEQWDDYLEAQKSYISTRGRRELEDKMLMSHVQDIDIVCRFQTLAGQMQCKVTIHGSMPFSLKIFGIHEASFEVSAKEAMTDAVKYLWQKH